MSWCAKAVCDASIRLSKKRLKEGSINGHCEMPECITHDHIDDLVAAMVVFLKLVQELPGLWKADINAAFRRIPIRPAHRWASGVAFRCGGKFYLRCIMLVRLEQQRVYMRGSVLVLCCAHWVGAFYILQCVGIAMITLHLSGWLPWNTRCIVLLV